MSDLEVALPTADPTGADIGPILDPHAVLGPEMTQRPDRSKAFDEPGTLRDPQLAARVRPFIDELIWYVRALASPRRSSV